MSSLSRGTIYKLFQRGDLVPVKVGTATRVPGAELERFVKASLQVARRRRGEQLAGAR